MTAFADPNRSTDAAIEAFLDSQLASAHDGHARFEKVKEDVDKIIADYRKEQSVKMRAISDEEIVERLIYALVNEGAKILEEGVALRPSDIDVVYLTGYGFPRYRGGPMLYADTVGLYLS